MSAAAPRASFTLADFTSEALIVPQLQARDMTGAIQELSQAFQSSDTAWNGEELARMALEREEQMSTAMDLGGTGAAFPHVRSTACPRLQFAMGRAVAPLAWDGSSRVRLVFLNAVPDSDAMGYLKLVSGMARIAKEAGLVEKICAVGGARELLELLKRVPVRE
jgi:mannitol/fructose-specific phosphotransferase system IIA component (Ntr-type)